jgi:TonB family protein
MQADDNPKPLTPNAPTIRRRHVVAFVAFVALSAGVHFTLGPGLTDLSPHWAVNDLRDQGLSIITLSRRNELRVMPKPTPTPTPPPIPLPRTKRNLALMKYREIGSALHLRPDVRPPARRKSTLLVERAGGHANDKSKDADVVTTNAEPTPSASQAPGASRVDTGAKHDDLSGSIVWGDDNPPRLLKLAPLGLDDRATGTVRVEVQVGPDGQVLAVQLVQSSGDSALDQAALNAARNSTFAPATLNGMPVHGTSILEFSPNTQST